MNPSPVFKNCNKRFSFKSLFVKRHFRYCNASFTSNLLRNEHNYALCTLSHLDTLPMYEKFLVLINFSLFAGKSGIAIKNNPQIMLVMKSEENCEQIGFRHKR